MSSSNERNIRTALITGVSGSGASYLADSLIAHQPHVAIHGISRWHSTSSSRNLASCIDRIVMHECDLNDMSSIMTVLRTVKPDAIFHLASYANVRESFTTPLAVLQNNIMGTANLFEAIRLAELQPIVLMVSTSELYGQVDPSRVPINEDCPLHPASPYAVSKTAQELLGYVYFKSYGMKVVRTRMFTYINPRRKDIFSTTFAMQVARIEAGLQQELIHGNLDSVRTIIDVRDAMESYWVAVQKCSFGEVYNIGGLKTLSVGEFLELLKKHARCPIPTRQDPRLLRPTDVTLQIPDVSKFTTTTGWKPKYSFDESVQFLLDHCRSEVAREVAAKKSS